MSTKHNFELFEQLEDLEDIPYIRNVPGKQHRYQPQSKNKPSTRETDNLSALAEVENGLNFTSLPSMKSG